MDSKKGSKSVQQNQRYHTLFIPYILPCQNLAPTLPTVQFDWQWFGCSVNRLWFVKSVEFPFNLFMCNDQRHIDTCKKKMGQDSRLNNRPEEESWSSACSHSVDVQLRCLQGDSGCGSLKHMFILASVTTYIRGSSWRERQDGGSQEDKKHEKLKSKSEHFASYFGFTLNCN